MKSFAQVAKRSFATSSQRPKQSTFKIGDLLETTTLLPTNKRSLQDQFRINPAARLQSAIEQYFPETFKDIYKLDSKAKTSYYDFSKQNPDKVFAGYSTKPILQKEWEPLTAKDFARDEMIMSLSPNLSSVTTKLIRSLKEPNNLSHLLTLRETAFLTTKGHTVENATEWAKALSSPDLSKAISLLQQLVRKDAEAAATGDKSSNTPIIPVFVITFLLKRRSFTGALLRDLLEITESILPKAIKTGDVTNRQIWILFARFHRLAKDIWPPGLISIASILTNYLFFSTRKSQDSAVTTLALLSNMYNRALWLLSQAPKSRPYLTALYREQAQFLILSKMTQYSQPIELDPLGYKGLVKVQLVSKHTHQERDWINLQSHSWPPYPEPKNRHDEEKGFDYASSRAMKTLRHMSAAGFSSPKWEQVVKVYAGWDVDGTPTIQSRSVTPNVNHILDNSEAGLWSARITVARDIRESWATFLQWESASTTSDGNHWIYFAIFRKLVAENDRLSAKDPFQVAIVGDVRQLIPPNNSPLQKVYLAEEIPSYMALFDRMIAAKVVPRQSLFAFILENAPSIQDGFEIWRTLTGVDTNIVSSATLENDTSTPMGPGSFQGFIALLMRFPLTEGLTPYLNPEEKSRFEAAGNDLAISKIRLGNIQLKNTALIQAYFLLHWNKSSNPTAWWFFWNGIIEASTQTSMSPSAFKFFELAKHGLKSMSNLKVHLEPRTFAYICRYFELAIYTARALVHHSTDPRYDHQERRIAEFTVAESPALLRELFRQLTEGTIRAEDAQKAAESNQKTLHIPTVLSLVTTMDLLRYVRALAALSDFTGMIDLAKWIVRNEDYIIPIMNIQNGGYRRWTYILSVLRLAFTSPSIMYPRYTEASAPSASPELLEELRNELNKLKKLEKWSRYKDIRAHLRSLDAGISSEDFPLHFNDNSFSDENINQGESTQQHLQNWMADGNVEDYLEPAIEKRASASS